MWGPLTQGIGTVLRGPFSETVSWLWAFPWQVNVYQSGIKAQKENWTDTQVGWYLDGLKKTDLSHDQLAFRANLRLQPSFDDNGAIDRFADASELSNVTVFLKVGDHLYSPLQQPGAVPSTSLTGSTDVTIPETTSTTTTKIVKDRHEKTHKKTETTITTTERHETVEYIWFQSVFDFWFDLKNPDGTYRITPADKEIEVVVMYGGNERRAKYKLDDFSFARKKT